MSKKTQGRELNVDFANLNVEDKELIAQLAGKSKKTVYAVLRGDRNNKDIIDYAKSVLAKKAQVKSQLFKEKYRKEIVEMHLENV